jgi:hypothetical protein
MMFIAFGCRMLLRRVRPVYRVGVPHPGLRKRQSFSATFIHPGRGRSLQLGDPLFHVAQEVLVRIAELVREQQSRIQGAAADARCCPLTLLLCFIKAVAPAFPRQAPRILLGVKLNPDQALQRRLRTFRLNTILEHVFSLVSIRSWIA